MRRCTFVALVAATALGLGARPAPDQQFGEHAAQDNQAEVELGRLAGQRAARDVVRQLGQRMVTDHSVANQELIALAQQKAIALPSGPTDEQRNIRDRLSALPGPEFDRAYLQEMIVDHQKDADEFEHEAQAGMDPDIKAWAAKTLPTIRQHLQMARAIHTQVVLGPAPPAAPAASMPAASIRTIVPPPAVTWCGGAHLPNAGTNFAGCPTR